MVGKGEEIGKDLGQWRLVRKRRKNGVNIRKVLREVVYKRRDGKRRTRGGEDVKQEEAETADRR